jgi:hypothetical protein
MTAEGTLGEPTCYYKHSFIHSFIHSFPTCSFFDEKLDNVVVAVEAGRPERRRIGLGRRVDVCPPLCEQPYNVGVACGRCAPERRGALYRLAVKRDRAGLLNVGVAPLDQVLDDLAVTVAAREDEGGRAIRLGRHQLLDLVLGTVLQKYLKKKEEKRYFSIIYLSRNI